MYTKVEVRTSSGALLTLQLSGTSNGITTRSVTGLDPVKATLVSSSFANQDGAEYQSGRRDTRNIVFDLGLSPDPAVTTVLALRRYVYSFFRPKGAVNLKFFVDDTDDSTEDGYEIDGIIESCTSEMFAQVPEVNISVLCFNPDFYDPIPVTVDSLTTADTTATDFPYIGTSPTGITLVLSVNRTLSEFTLYYTDPNGVTWSMDVAYAFVTGDVVTISTVPGNKFATLVRAGVTSSVLFAVSPQSVWPQLAPGDNQFRIFAEGAAIPGTITYTKLYGEL